MKTGVEREGKKQNEGERLRGREDMREILRNREREEEKLREKLRYREIG